MKEGRNECPRPTRFFFNLLGLREGGGELKMKE